MAVADAALGQVFGEAADGLVIFGRGLVVPIDADVVQDMVDGRQLDADVDSRATVEFARARTVSCPRPYGLRFTRNAVPL